MILEYELNVFRDIERSINEVNSMTDKPYRVSLNLNRVGQDTIIFELEVDDD